MYKVVFTVAKVSPPTSIEGKPCHVAGPCPLYKVGDRITMLTKPTRLVMEETSQVCLYALGPMLPMVSTFCRESAEPNDYINKINYFSCADAERPVIFRVERIPIGPIPPVAAPKDQIPLELDNRRAVGA
jgi:uncharacterized repeat protein (TIGR04076 family)